LPIFSAEPERKESLHLAFPISLHLVLNLNARKVFALLPYFPTFSAEPERRESLHLAFPVSLHLVLNLNAREVFALLSLFPYIWCSHQT